MGDELKDRTYSADWFKNNIPSWDKWLSSLKGKPGLRALEIGSFEGQSTVWLMENILTDASSHIDCIDLFTDETEFGDYYSRFHSNTSEFNEKISTFKGTSFEQLKLMSGPYDIVYVDGWHSAFGALADGVMSWPLLKVGGVMIFDDYLWVPPRIGPYPRATSWARRFKKWTGRSWKQEALEKQIASVAPETPKLGIDSLLATLEGHYQLLGKNYQLAIEKTKDFGSSSLGHDT